MAAEKTYHMNEDLKTEIISNINRVFTKPESANGEYNSNNNHSNMNNAMRYALYRPRDYNTHFDNLEAESFSEEIRDKIIENPLLLLEEFELSELPKLKLFMTEQIAHKTRKTRKALKRKNKTLRSLSPVKSRSRQRSYKILLIEILMIIEYSYLLKLDFFTQYSYSILDLSFLGNILREKGDILETHFKDTNGLSIDRLKKMRDLAYNLVILTSQETETDATTTQIRNTYKTLYSFLNNIITFSVKSVSKRMGHYPDRIFKEYLKDTV